MWSFTAEGCASNLSLERAPALFYHFPPRPWSHPPDRPDMSAPLPPVLVVDDEKNMRLSLKTVLSDEGYPVRTVESAEEALSLLAHEEVFMVITDARLGGMSGYEFLGRAREKWPDLPVLMI